MTSANGLEGVVVADTRLSHIDGEAGRLVVRGRDIERFAGEIAFEQACGLLWGKGDEAELRPALGHSRMRAFEALPRLGDALARPDGMDALRAAIAHAEGESAVDLTAAMAVYAAAWSRRVRGLETIEPDPAAPHAVDYLRMVTGERPEEARARALETYLVCVMDHGMNASTFTARVVASTESDAASAVVAALGALKGPLHGGAPGPVLEMFDEIGEPAHAERWILAALEAGRRIMGLGHRVYRVRDPRAAVLETAVRGLREAGLEGDRLALARAIEEVAVGVLRAKYPNRSLAVNVEFYTAVLLDAVGLPIPLFTPTFAVARVVGWLAHIHEQRAGGRIIRPRANYIGDLPARPAA